MGALAITHLSMHGMEELDFFQDQQEVQLKYSTKMLYAGHSHAYSQSHTRKLMKL